MSNPQSLCRHLRTKASYVPALQSDDYLEASHPTAQYWCLKTTEGLGPDRRLVCPEECKPPRVCFEPPGESLAA